MPTPKSCRPPTPPPGPYTPEWFQENHAWIELNVVNPGEVIEAMCYPPRADLPPRRRGDPFIFDRLRSIPQPPPQIPKSTIVRLEVDEKKLPLTQHPEWAETLRRVAEEEEGWSETHVGAEVGKPHRVVLIFTWKEEPPEAIRSHHVLEEPSVFSFAPVRHLLAAEPEIASIPFVRPSSSSSMWAVDECLMIRGPQKVVEERGEKLLKGLEVVSNREKQSNHDPEFFVGYQYGWVVDDDPAAERKLIINLFWTDREKEVEFRTKSFNVGERGEAIWYDKYFTEPLKELERDGAVVEKVDVDYVSWDKPKPVPRTMRRAPWCHCFFQ